VRIEFREVLKMLMTLFDLPTTIRNYAFRGSATRKLLLLKLVAYYPIGRVIFRISILIKKISLFMGKWSQRAIEYPWLLKNLKVISRESLVLDVGCSESALSCELIARGFRVAGIDIKDYPFKDKRLIFLRRNVLDTKLPNDLFDVIIVISTIEHIGLEAYGQSVKDTHGDTKALRELRRILKPQGIIIITTPYIGNSELKINSFERQYNRQRLKELIEGMNPIKESYFYPYRLGNRLYWLEVWKEKIDKLPFRKEAPGLACLILQKARARIK
jgi:SAM-dependent methyltransferase